MFHLLLVILIVHCVSYLEMKNPSHNFHWQMHKARGNKNTLRSTGYSKFSIFSRKSENPQSRAIWFNNLNLRGGELKKLFWTRNFTYPAKVKREKGTPFKLFLCSAFRPPGVTFRPENRSRRRLVTTPKLMPGERG